MEQWRLDDDDTGLSGTRVRSWAVGSQTEGCVADDANGWLFIGEEEVGIWWRYGAEPGAPPEGRVAADRVGVGEPQGGHVASSVEGLSIHVPRVGGSRRRVPGGVEPGQPHLRRLRRRKGEVLVTVFGAPLDWRSSLAVRNHSPTGPAWGYGGSGPAQLALAILLTVTDEATAERYYQKFKWDVLAPLEVDRWVLDAGDILSWLESAAGTDDVVPLAVET